VPRRQARRPVVKMKRFFALLIQNPSQLSLFQLLAES
jgi:hypothetical protein